MKNILIIIIVIITFVACDITDVEPTSSIPEEIAFNDEASVRSAVVGCYDALQSTGYYGRYYTVIPDLLANNLDHNGTTQEYAEFSDNSVQSDNFIIDGIWASIYDGINRANMVIANIDKAGMNQDDEKAYLAHCYFLRAVNYFNLVRTYGGVPLKTSPSNEPGEHLNIPRSSIDEVYTKIEEDLAYAETNIISLFNGSANKAVVEALLAKVHLYQGSWDLAKSYANSVIEDYNYSLEPSYADLFPANFSTESVFEIAYNEQDNNILAQYFFPTAVGGRHEFIPSEELINAYNDANDEVRLNSSITEDANGIYCSKYTEISTRSDNVYVVRLSELYLIRAEAEARLDGDITTIQNDINTVRNRVFLDDTEANTIEELLIVIEQERRKELAFEGEYWFDLVRTNRALDLLENVTSQDQYLMPIPLSEMQTNENMTQNPGY